MKQSNNRIRAPRQPARAFLGILTVGRRGPDGSAAASDHRRGGLFRGALILVLWSTALRVSALNVGWHDQMSIQLGDGVDLKRQYEPKAPLVVMGGATTNLNSGEAIESAHFVQSTYDMVKSLSVNGSVSLNFLAFGGDIGGSFSSQQSRHDNDLTFVYTAIRNFGQTYYAVLDFTPDFKATVAALQTSYQGQALHSAITDIFGTHYVHGYESAAMVWVVYTFHFASASDRQQFSISYSGNDISASVNSFFSSANANRRMNYQFYTSDPFQSPTNFNFSTAGSIQSVQGYTNFLTKVQAYWRTMDPARGKVTGYMLDPIETLPGYQQLLGGSAPQPAPLTDYDTFLQTYTTLQAWNQRLTDWAQDPNRMNWLTTNGQQMARSKRAAVANYAAAMRSIALNHFQNGTALQVPTNVTSYLGTLTDIPIPTIYVLQSFTNQSTHFLLGWVDCGPAELTVPSPFNAISVLHSETEVGALAAMYYSPADFLKDLAPGVASFDYAGGTNVIPFDYGFGIIYFSVPIPPSFGWVTLTNQINRISANYSHETIGFFSASVPTSQNSNWSVAIRDLEGNTVDEIPWLSTRTGGTSAATAGSTPKPVPAQAGRGKLSSR